MAKPQTLREIRLPCYGITVRLNRLPGAAEPGCGTIASQLKEIPGEIGEDSPYNAAIDGMEALVLAHACAGLDIESAAYLEGIEVGRRGHRQSLYLKETFMPLTAGQKRNFSTLRRAFHAGDVALMECQLAATDEAVAVLCAANRHADQSMDFVPLAMFFADDPYRALNPPNPDGGFFSQEDVHGDDH